MNIIDTLTSLHDSAVPGSGAAAAYADTMHLIENIENLNVLAWKLIKLRDDAEASNWAPAYRESYLHALENAHRLALELRIDDE